MDFVSGILFGLVCAGAALYWQRTQKSDNEDTDEHSSDDRRRRRTSSSSVSTLDDASSSGGHDAQPPSDSSSNDDSGRSRQHSPLLEESYQELSSMDSRRSRDSTPTQEPSSNNTDSHEPPSLQSSSTTEPIDRIESGAHDTLGSDSTVPDRPSVLEQTEEGSVESSGSSGPIHASPSASARSDTCSKEPDISASSDLHWLIGLVGEIEDETFHLGHDQVTLGRSPNCDIQVTQGEISRTHFRLRSTGEDLKLETAQTVNETRVDGSVVQQGECIDLEDGDIVEIGGVAAFEYHRKGDFECDDLDDSEPRRGIGTDTDTVGAGGEALDRRIEQALERTNYNLDRASSMLGIDSENLSYLMDEFDIDER